MPFTYLAHQAPALAIKRRWPTSFGGTALALGTMAPDWAYALNGSRLAFDAHSLPGVVAFCAPVAMVVAIVLRSVSPALFTYAPNPRQMPLQQLRVLALRRPPLATTAFSAALGALTMSPGTFLPTTIVGGRDTSAGSAQRPYRLLVTASRGRRCSSMRRTPSGRPSPCCCWRAFCVQVNSSAGTGWSAIPGPLVTASAPSGS